MSGDESGEFTLALPFDTAGDPAAEREEADLRIADAVATEFCQPGGTQ